MFIGANLCSKCFIRIIAFTHLPMERKLCTHFTYDYEVKLFLSLNYLPKVILLENGKAGTNTGLGISVQILLLHVILGKPL